MIPLKNYLKVLMLYIVVAIICIVLVNRYNSYQELKKKEPVLRGTIQEITNNDIDSYITDNRDVLLYIGVATNDNCRNLEVKLKTFLKKELLTNDVVYVNITGVKDFELFYKSFNDKYAIDRTLSSYPAFIIIRDGKIKDLVENTSSQKLQVGDIEYLLDQYEIKVY